MFARNSNCPGWLVLYPFSGVSGQLLKHSGNIHIKNITRATAVSIPSVVQGRIPCTDVTMLVGTATATATATIAINISAIRIAKITIAVAAAVAAIAVVVAIVAAAVAVAVATIAAITNIAIAVVTTATCITTSHTTTIVTTITTTTTTTIAAAFIVAIATPRSSARISRRLYKQRLTVGSWDSKRVGSTRVCGHIVRIEATVNEARGETVEKRCHGLRTAFHIAAVLPQTRPDPAREV